MESYTLLFFFCVFLSPVSSAGFVYNRQYVNNESLAVENVKTELKTGKYCLPNQIYNEVRKSSQAMKAYADHVCSLNGTSGSSQYIYSNYGNQEELLGSGSFGKVYKFVKGNDKYAIKIPKSYKVFDLFEELHASFCLKENVPKDKLSNFGYILECVTPTGKNPHLIMKFYPTVLTDYIANDLFIGWDTSKLEMKEKILLAVIALVKEVNIMHQVRLAHRDLKPDNIMMDDNGYPILVDFGMTSSNFDLAKSNKGTPLYLDYEMSKKRGNGEASDIYALGLIIYEMVAGAGGVDNITKMVLSGGYGTNNYNPKFSSLNIPNEFAWLNNMFIPIGSGVGIGKNRWNLQQVMNRLDSLAQEYGKQIQAKQENKNDLFGKNDVKKLPTFTKRKSYDNKPNVPLPDYIFRRQKSYVDKPNVPEYKALSPIKMKQYTGNPYPYLNNNYDHLEKVYKQINPTVIRKYVLPTQYVRYKAPLYTPAVNYNGGQYNIIGARRFIV